MFTFLQKLPADSAYRAPVFLTALARIRKHIKPKSSG
jgi:hypothetical protein